MKGKFVVFEGLDKSGKSTQFDMFCDHLTALRIPYNKIHSPSDLPVGKMLREVLEGRAEVSPELIRLMFVVDKMMAWEGFIKSAIDDGEWVISHRWVLSTLAYGQVDGFYLGWLMQINQYVRVPDLTIYIDTPPEICIERLEKEKGEPHLYEKLNQLQGAYERYDWLLSQNPFARPNIRISGDATEREVYADLIIKFNEIIPLEAQRD